MDVSSILPLFLYKVIIYPMTLVRRVHYQDYPVVVILSSDTQVHLIKYLRVCQFLRLIHYPCRQPSNRLQVRSVHPTTSLYTPKQYLRPRQLIYNLTLSHIKVIHLAHYLNLIQELWNNRNKRTHQGVSSEKNHMALLISQVQQKQSQCPRLPRSPASSYQIVPRVRLLIE